MNNQDQQFESFVPVYDMVPEKWEDARQFLVEHLKKISNAVNIREIGWYLDEELLSGGAFIPGVTIPGNNPANYRQIFRKVIDFGPLPNTGTKTIPHGITFDNNFTLLHLYGAATQPSSNAIPLPYIEVAVTPGNIQLYMNTTHVIVITESNRSAYTRCFITIEYIQEI